MIRLLISLVTVGAVIGCQVENPEPTSGTLNVDPNSEEEVPEWVTASDLDLNRDGTIDIKDLVIMSKFFGQDVPEPTIASATDEPKVCQDIRAGIIFGETIDYTKNSYPGWGYVSPYWETGKYSKEVVKDNIDYTKKFSSSDGGTYSYALLLLTSTNSSKISEIDGHLGGGFYENSELTKLESHFHPSCFAVRFYFSDNFSTTQLKVKPVAGPEDMSLETLTSPLITTGTKVCGRQPFYDMFYDPSSGQYIATKTAWRFGLHTRNTQKTEGCGELGSPEHNRILKEGIPIGNDKVVDKVGFSLDKYHNRFIHYLKMLPSEVRRRYFREDIEATGN